MPESATECLLQSSTVRIRDVRCRGSYREQAAEEYATANRLVDRIKLVLASDPARRWTLADIASPSSGNQPFIAKDSDSGFLFPGE